MPPASHRPRRRPRIRLRSAVIGAAALSAVAAAPALAAFTLDGSIANVPGNLQPASEPSVVLGGLKGHGSARVPWIAQVEPNAGGGPTQVFVEKFAGGQFSVPWTAWEEDAGGVSQIFASRFLPNADLQNGVWEINGALRGSVASPGTQRGPSPNFNPDKGADEPRVHGGSL